jgi:hypothetical protein
MFIPWFQPAGLAAKKLKEGGFYPKSVWQNKRWQQALSRKK